jgi:hypothetical protein
MVSCVPVSAPVPVPVPAGSLVEGLRVLESAPLFSLSDELLPQLHMRVLASTMIIIRFIFLMFGLPYQQYCHSQTGISFLCLKINTWFAFLLTASLLGKRIVNKPN